jgi:4-hydroxybenzoate polyprenyltransferase
MGDPLATPGQPAQDGSLAYARGAMRHSAWPLIKAMRPHQWAKNLLILLPILASHDFTALGTALVAMVAFSLIASSVYIVNDLADLESDRAHPRKRNRPFASGRASIPQGILLAALLIVAALVLSLVFTPIAFVATLLLYLAATVAYSFWLKRKLLVDIIALAGLYTTRILAGAAATGIALSPWLLAFSMFLFFSLAAIKRQAELVDQERAGRSNTPGRAYFTDDLPTIRNMAVSSGQAAVLVLALYINSPAIVGLYALPNLMWLLCPILFYWLSRMVIMTHRGFMDDDPIVFACRDRISLLCLLAMAIVVFVAVLGYRLP